MKSYNSGFPYITLCVVMLCLAVKAFPALQGLFIYDRDAIVSGGYWRLLTGHFAHFSWEHLIWNVAIFSVAGVVIEAREYKGYLQLCVLSALAIGVCLFRYRPEMGQYAGLSGLATTLVVYVSLSEMRKDEGGKWMWFLILLLVITKTMIETRTGSPLFVSAADSYFMVSPDAHIVGALIGSLYYLLFSESRPFLFRSAVKSRQKVS